MSASPQACAADAAGTPTSGLAAAEGTARVSDGADTRSTHNAVASTATAGVVVVSQLERYAVSAYGETNGHMEAPERTFVALLAPNANASTEFLATQPSSAYVLSKCDDGSIELHIKFLQSVRVAVIVKAREWKKGLGAVDWDTSERHGGVLHGSLPPVHRMRVAEEVYCHLERCWCDFMPHVQSIVFELCCEAPIDEALRLEECADLLEASSPPPLLALLAPEASGFYLLDGLSGLQEQSLGIYTVRLVEFDFVKFCFNVADGTFKPNAMVMATQLSHRRTLDPDLTFKILRDNFQFPDRVILKETQVATVSPGPQQYIEVSVSDSELVLLRSVAAACKSVTPLETGFLPDSLITSLDALYVHLVASNKLPVNESERNISRLSTEKSKLVTFAFPLIIEIVAAIEVVYDCHSMNEPTLRSDKGVFHDQAVRLSKALHLIAVNIASRCDDAATARIVFTVLRIFNLRSQLPSPIVKLIRDLCGTSPHFRRLFTRSQGVRLLWSAIHSASKPIQNARSNLDSIEPELSSSIELNRSGQRKPSLFARVAQGPKKRSLLGTGLKAAGSHVRVFALFHFDPNCTETGLLKQLAAHQFCDATLGQVESTLECCYCHRYVENEWGNHSENVMQTRQHCARCQGSEPVNVSAFELILELGKHLLVQDVKSQWWDKSVAMIIRCEKLHNSIAEDVFHISEQLSQSSDVSEQLIASMHCRRFIAVESITLLFTLERKRRQHMTTVIGDKKYIPFLELMRSKLNDVNVFLASDSNDLAVATSVLEAHSTILRWVPVSMLEEWLTLSISEVFETVDSLNQRLERDAVNDSTALARSIASVTEIFSILLDRIISSDTPTLLIRLLNRGYKPVIPLLRTVLGIDDTRAFSAKRRVIRFLTTFSAVYRDLPVRNQWFRAHTNVVRNEDEEELEQRRDEILQQYLVFDEKHDISLWEFLVRFACPMLTEDSSTTVESSDLFAPSVATSQFMDETSGEAYSLLVAAGLMLQLTLYGSLSQDYNVEVNLVQAVANHIGSLNECSSVLDEPLGRHADPSQIRSICRVLELHLNCLISLANRRTLFPQIQDAFDKNKVLSVLMKVFVKPSYQSQPISNEDQFSSFQNDVKADDVHQPHVVQKNAPLPGDETASLPASQDTGPPIFRLRLDKLQRSDSTISTGDSVDKLHKYASSPRGILVRDEHLHSLLVILFVSYMLMEPTHELDEAFCPRFAPLAHDGQAGWTSNAYSDILWQLQQHLACEIQLDLVHFERALFDMETTRAFVSASRATTIRRLVRLICPKVFDRTLYAAPGEVSTSSFDISSDIAIASARKDYIAKGATAAVYRTTPVIENPSSVSLKVLRQVRDGDLCAIASVYNEVTILKRLRGERAALQILDFGNRHQDKNYEVVTEWCPSTLSEWRRSFSRQVAVEPTTQQADVPDSVSFRMCSLMILRCFRKVCVCLARIHARRVCHFDIKSENLFLRTSSSDFSARVIMHGEKSEDEKKASSIVGCVCFGDFGESMIAEPEGLPLRACLSFVSGGPSASTPAPPPTKKNASSMSCLISRTRGTEAIKSPEVFKIRGNEAAKTRVTFASDIWSIGCLLYELIVQELLFEKDEWPALYAHLVSASDDSKVLREDHIQKLQDALSPTSDCEQRIVTQLIDLCALILDRKPERRPTLTAIVTRVSAVIQDVLQLPISAEEKAQMKHFVNAQAESASNCSRRNPVECSSVTTFRAWHRQPVASTASFAFQKTDWNRWYPTVVTPRLFWNFFIGGTIPQLRKHRLSSVGVDILACQDFEIIHEHEFVHFVYFSWTPGVENASSTSWNVISRVQEHERFTIIQIDRKLWWLHHNSRQSSATESTAALALNSLLRQAPAYFPVLQRRLRLEPGRVALVCAPEEVASERDTSAEALKDAMASILLVFLERTTAMSPLDTLAAFARDCSPHFLAYPHRAFAHQLSAFASKHQALRRELAASEAQHSRDDQKRLIVICLCGACVWSVRVLAVRQAAVSQQCSCSAAGAECPSFHPFTSPGSDLANFRRAHEDDDEIVGEDEPGPVDDTFIHDPWEEQLVLPMEMRARLRSPVQWVVVTREAVERRESLLSPPSAARSTAAESVAAPRRQSVVSIEGLRRMIRKDSESPRVQPSPPPALSTPSTCCSTRDPLLRGLVKREARERRSSRDAWTLLECQLCRLPMAAVTDADASRVALPMVGDARSL